MGVAGSQEMTAPRPGAAFSPQSAQLEARSGRRQETRTRSQSLTPPAGSLPPGLTLVSTLRHLSQLEWQHNPGDDLRGTEHTPS